MIPAYGLWHEYRKRKETVLNKIEWLDREWGQFIDDPEYYVRGRVQEWHNDECNRTHAIDLPFDQRSYTEYSIDLKQSSIFAKMSPVEQKAILYSELLDKVRNNSQEMPLMLDYPELERELYELRGNTLDRARDTVQSRLELTRKFRSDRTVLRAYDPRTEYQIRYPVTLEENENEVREQLIEMFPKELFEQVSEDENLLYEVENDS